MAATPDIGLIILPPAPIATSRALVNRLAIQHRVPTIYGERAQATEGGLMSYGPVYRELYRRNAYYVDRLLRGAKPADLPVQFPTKFELVVNLRTAKAIGLEISPALLAAVDEVIE